MPLESIHFLLTYVCNFECDHCFLYCSPRSNGTFTLDQIEKVLDDIKQIPSITSVSFEGGEPFLFYPLLLEAIGLSTRQGLLTSIETNTYWATTVRDAQLWLKPLHQAGLTLLNVSDDSFHHGETDNNSAKCALKAAENIGLKTHSIKIEKPRIATATATATQKGIPIYSGGPKLRGRAVDKLIDGLPTTKCTSYIECPFENLSDPQRVHLDAYGHVHLCQGLSMGNCWETALHELVNSYTPDTHPICGPLVKGGPVELARQYGISFEEGCVDACHFCTKTCKALIDRFPQYLAPRQVYGLEMNHRPGAS